MLNYNVNWDFLVEANLPHFKRKFYRIKWVRFLVSEVQKLHAKFLIYKDNSIYKISHNGMKISMEKVLNDQFDAINELIFIGLAISQDQMYLFQKPELQLNYIYSKYNAATAYVIGEFAVYGNSVWICIANSTGNTPADPSAFWDFHKQRQYLFKKEEYTTPGFIVYVPNTLVYDLPQMVAWIEKYKLAGMPYTIETYIP